MLLVFVLGDVLGAGIYVLVGEVAGEVGGAIWAPFLIALALALLTAASYAELAGKYPRAGGAALFAGRAFRSDKAAFAVAFAVACSGIASASTLARAFGGDYLQVFVSVPDLPIALAFLAALALINFRGILGSLRLNIALTTIECLGLLTICVIGMAAVLGGEGDPGRALELNPDSGTVAALLGATALAFYALIGFEDSANLAEETKEPGSAYPWALFGGLAIAGVIYLAVTGLATMVVPTAELAGSSAPLAEAAQRGPLAIEPEIFSAIALVAIANGALINMIMVSRLIYGMAREGVLPESLGRVHARRGTPWVAILASTAAALILVSTGDLKTLASTTVVLLLLVFVVVNVSVLMLRNEEVPGDHFRAPTVVPIAGAVSCAIVLTQTPAAAWTRAGVAAIIGVLLWLVDRVALSRRDQ
jgi:amino acid transporter